MKTLIISKPIYDYILPLVEFPLDGDKFYINNSIRTINDVTSITAMTLAKFGMDVSYTGVIGDDELGRKIKEIYESFNIDTKYIETSYGEKTTTNYKIYNQKTNKFTTINEKSITAGLSKYKYEFIPNNIIMDDGDYNANLAALNNYPNANKIYIGDKFTKDTQVYCNRCNYVIATLPFASLATGITNNLNKPKNIVHLFQKYVDLYNSNLIVILDNFDVLYCVNDEVRIIKNINKNLVNKENLFKSLFIFFLCNSNNVEESIKYTNKLMLDTSNDLDMIKNIPEVKTVKELIDQVRTSDIKETPTVQNTNTSENIEELNTFVDNNEIDVPKLEVKEGQNEIEKL